MESETETYTHPERGERERGELGSGKKALSTEVGDVVVKAEKVDLT